MKVIARTPKVAPKLAQNKMQKEIGWAQ